MTQKLDFMLQSVRMEMEINPLTVGAYAVAIIKVYFTFTQLERETGPF